MPRPLRRIRCLHLTPPGGSPFLPAPLRSPPLLPPPEPTHTLPHARGPLPAAAAARARARTALRLSPHQGAACSLRCGSVDPASRASGSSPCLPRALTRRRFRPVAPALGSLGFPQQGVSRLRAFLCSFLSCPLCGSWWVLSAALCLCNGKRGCWPGGAFSENGFPPLRGHRRVGGTAWLQCVHFLSCQENHCTGKGWGVGAGGRRRIPELF